MRLLKKTQPNLRKLIHVKIKLAKINISKHSGHRPCGIRYIADLIFQLVYQKLEEWKRVNSTKDKNSKFSFNNLVNNYFRLSLFIKLDSSESGQQDRINIC